MLDENVAIWSGVADSRVVGMFGSLIVLVSSTMNDVNCEILLLEKDYGYSTVII